MQKQYTDATFRQKEKCDWVYNQGQKSTYQPNTDKPWPSLVPHVGKKKKKNTNQNQKPLWTNDNKVSHTCHHVYL